MSKERINNLIEQTSFLLEKQKELSNKTTSVFGAMIDVVEKKLKQIDQSARTQDVQDLKSIHEFVSGHKEKSHKGIVEDIEFLTEQLVALNQIKSVNDDVKMEELLNMVISKEEKLPDTQAFKKMITDDLSANFRDLDLMFDDMKSAIEQDDIHEIKLLLEAIKDQDAQDGHEEHDCDSQSCSSCEQSCCKGGVDIFSDFSKLEQDKKKDEEDCGCSGCGCGCSDCDK